MLAFNHLGTLGRLGNQMFQYASLRGIAAKRTFEYGIPPSNFQDEWRNHQLLQVFELTDLPKKNITFLDNGHAPIVKEKKFTYDEELHNLCPNEVSLWGFFQSEKYFKDIEHEYDIVRQDSNGRWVLYGKGSGIRGDFTFREHILKPCKEMAESLDDDAISLHVRRTDYLQNSANHFNLQLDYYEKALTNFSKDRQVVVFSDDPEWCKEQELFSDDRFLVSESGDNAIDLCLMTFCKAHIIANSSFSWWGAWLADSKEVIAPSTWFGPDNADKSTEDLIPERWTLI